MGASRLNLNRACNLEDFADPELRAVLRQVFAHHCARTPEYPAGREDRKHWEVAMALIALERTGVLHPDAEVLGIGAGTEPTLFWLTTIVRRVFATDRYLAPGVWEANAPPAMLTNPGALWVGPWRGDRLVVQHMDARGLSYENDSFDAIFSSGSIEHFGELADISHALDEACRVLKPGGFASLSTELRLDGPAPGIIPGLALFDREMLEQIVIGERPWDPVDELQLEVSARTRATELDHALPQADLNHARDRAQSPIQEADVEYTEYPQLVMRLDRYAFTSVHVTLRKRLRSDIRVAARPPEPLGRRLAAQLPDPLVIVDAGARWGFGAHWEELLPFVELIGFEPDADEAERLSARYAETPRAHVHPLALGSEPGRVPLTHYRSASSDSGYRHDETFLERFDIDRSGDVAERVIEVEQTTIDGWATRERIARVDAIKLDVEGAELEILKGAEHALGNVRALEIEVCFNPLRLGAPLFGEIDAFLRERGFALWRVRDEAFYPIKGGDGAAPSPERFYEYPHPPTVHPGVVGILSWANAHFVRRDAFLDPGPRPWDALLRDACLAVALRFDDLALIALRRLLDGDPPTTVGDVAAGAVDELLARGAAAGR